MKKLLTIAIAILVSGALQAQSDKVKREKKNYLVLHAGPSVPAGDFGCTSATNQQSGYAKTGYTVNINYGYQCEKNAGFSVSIFYSGYSTHNFKLTYLDGTPNSSNIKLDKSRWTIYGISAGPMLTIEVAHKVLADGKLMAGIINASWPKIMYQGQTIANSSNNCTAAIQAGLNLRINAGSNRLVFINTDYMYLKPRFSYTYTNSSDEQVSKTMTQKISVVNISAGIGFNF